MSDIKLLHELIKETAKQPVNVNDYGKRQVILTEPQCPKVSVTISGLPDSVIVIKADTFTSPDSVFIGSHGECKRADFVIIADTGSKKIILCIELKATKGSAKEIIQQLSGAQCFVSYCQKIGQNFWGQSSFLEDYTYRFVSIGHISITKHKTRIDRRKETHDRPDRMMKVSSPHRLEFNHLAGGN
jgi:hypothetical protein